MNWPHFHTISTENRILWTKLIKKWKKFMIIISKKKECKKFSKLHVCKINLYGFYIMNLYHFWCKFHDELLRAWVQTRRICWRKGQKLNCALLNHQNNPWENHPLGNILWINWTLCSSKWSNISKQCAYYLFF